MSPSWLLWFSEFPVMLCCATIRNHEEVILMKTASIKDDLFAEIDKLPYDLQLRVLDFTKSLSRKGVKGDSLLRFEGSIPADDLRAMSDAIERDCERIDGDEW
jgi:hypothetical protein